VERGLVGEQLPQDQGEAEDIRLVIVVPPRSPRARFDAVQLNSIQTQKTKGEQKEKKTESDDVVLTKRAGMNQ